MTPSMPGTSGTCQRVNARRAWQMVFDSTAFTPTNEVYVAVVDSGLDVDHPDFEGRALPGKNYVEEDVDGDGFPELDPLNVADRCGHGTHVAGIIAATLNDSVGVAGVAPNVKIGGSAPRSAPPAAAPSPPWRRRSRMRPWMEPTSST